MKYEITIRNTETDELTTVDANAMALLAFNGEKVKFLFEETRVIVKEASLVDIAWAIEGDARLMESARIAWGYKRWKYSPEGMIELAKIELRKLGRWLRGEEPGDSGA